MVVVGREISVSLRLKSKFGRSMDFLALTRRTTIQVILRPCGHSFSQPRHRPLSSGITWVVLFKGRRLFTIGTHFHHPPCPIPSQSTSTMRQWTLRLSKVPHLLFLQVGLPSSILLWGHYFEVSESGWQASGLGASFSLFWLDKSYRCVSHVQMSQLRNWL